MDGRRDMRFNCQVDGHCRKSKNIGDNGHPFDSNTSIVLRQQANKQGIPVFEADNDSSSIDAIAGDYEGATLVTSSLESPGRRLRSSRAR